MTLHEEIQREAERREADIIPCAECGGDSGERYSDFDRFDPPPIDPVCPECERGGS